MEYPTMYELQVDTDFAAAHNLRGYKGKCEALHGHNWKVNVALQSPELDELGMVMDFVDVKKMLAKIMGRLDHKYLNEVEPFTNENPTTENIARMIHVELSAKLAGGPVSVAKVTVWESERSAASYYEG